jgi:hypothetical protein
MEGGAARCVRWLLRAAQLLLLHVNLVLLCSLL